LHISPELLINLAAAGIEHEYVTLHIGAGTFQPVKTDDTDNHIMHSEAGFISEDVAAKINQAKKDGRRIIACGTTALRVLEAATLPDGVVQPFASETSIFITPGYRFRCVDGLLTNFHLPRSSLLMLAAAFIGLEQIQTAYRVAIASGYRFYSYGDASLLLPERDSA
ncbi:MAG: S-adenosylmethionine:tRNA ribosyltransferase-isomerase, partial [Alphaproteobacteria bacterium]|nr:S-adenosylmethionine:tRNA ribosyltransferase-isomerase [Alphaproteobacteria bacterium]